jgi:hypothetical protein
MKYYPCDATNNDGSHTCPYCYDENSYVDCRQMCGLGCDEDEPDFDEPSYEVE